MARQPEGRPDLIDLLARLAHRGLGDPELVLVLFKVLAADGRRAEQPPGALVFGSGLVERGLPGAQGGPVGSQLGDLAVDLLGGELEFPALAARLRLQRTGLGLGRGRVRLGRLDGGALQINLHLKRFLVELDEQVPLLDAVVVVHQDPGHLAGHPGGHEGHVAVDVGVVRAHGIERRNDPRDQEVSRDRQTGRGPRQQQPLPPAGRGRRGDGRLGRGDAGRTVRRRGMCFGVRRRTGRGGRRTLRRPRQPLVGRGRRGPGRVVRVSRNHSSSVHD